MSPRVITTACAAMVLTLGAVIAAAAQPSQPFPHLKHAAPRTHSGGSAAGAVGSPTTPGTTNSSSAAPSGSGGSAPRARGNGSGAATGGTRVPGNSPTTGATTGTPQPNGSSAPTTGAAAPPTTGIPVPTVPTAPGIPAAPSPFVKTCGTQFCLEGHAFPLYGGSVLGALDDPVGRVNLAVSEHLNVVRIVNFIRENSTDIANAPYDAGRWAKVDRAIATARSSGLRVILDMSTYRNLLRANGVNAYTIDWAPFVSFVTNRVNTITGVRYRDDPTIAIISIAGEVDGLNVPGPTIPTTRELTDFYARTIRELHADDPNHLVSCGGLLHLDTNSGIDWRAIFSLPGNDVPAIHVYSAGDETKTIPAVGTYTRQIGKPWLVEEFGFPQNEGDIARASDFQRVYDESAAQGAAGVLFWNVGPEILGVNGKAQTYDVGPFTPRTFDTVVANASRW